MTQIHDKLREEIEARQERQRRQEMPPHVSVLQIGRAGLIVGHAAGELVATATRVLAFVVPDRA